MLTLKQIRDDKEAAIRRLAKKGVDAAPIIAKIEQLDDRRKAIQAELDSCLAEQNAAAKQIGMLIAQGKREEVVMGYVLQRGPRCKKAFAEGRDPTEEEMDRDAEVVNNLVMTMMSARTVMLPEAPEEGAPVPASVTEALDEAARKDA